MPGIVGFATKLPRRLAERRLLRMVETLRHESFYRTGTWIDEELGIYVGWAARKHSFCDGMPLINETGDVVLVFSGEDFAEPGTQNRLNERGHEFEAEGSSYLVHLYEEDSRFPVGLNGRFHGLVIDRKRRGTAMLFNDRYGMQRIYYHQAKDTFYFAAEAKAILATQPELGTISPKSLGEFISCGCVLENRTIFEDIHVLPAGAAWMLRDGSVQAKRFYFQPEQWEQQAKLDPEAYYQQMREVFTRNLPRYFGGPQQIGISLTGGLDTRMIMAWHKDAPGSLPCYTFGGMFRDCQDVIVARRVAKACGQPHTVIPVGEEFLSCFPHYAERTVYLSDGCVDLSHSPDLYANELAAQIAPIRMTGNYGGEVLRRARGFRPVEPIPGLFQPEILSQVNNAKETYTRLVERGALSFNLFCQAPWHHYGLLALEQTQLTLRSPYLDNEFVRTVFRAPASTFETDVVCRRLIADGDRVLAQIRTDRGIGGDSPRLIAGVVRALLEFTFRSEYAYDYGMPQGVAAIDHALSPLHLERLFLGRHKFYHFRFWYRDRLAGYVREMLLDPRALSRPYINRKGLETIVNAHLRGNRNYTTAIHKVLTLELLHRLLVDSTSALKEPAKEHELVA